MKTFYVLFAAVAFTFCCTISSVRVYGQCTVATPPTQPTCGAPGELLLTAGTTTASGKVYYYSGTGTLTNVTIGNGSTIVVCGNLTLTAPTDNATSYIFVTSTGSLTINNTTAGGNQLQSEVINRGSVTFVEATNATPYDMDTYIWNYGTMNFDASPVFETGGTTFYNATSTSSIVVQGSLTTYGNMVNNGSMTVNGTYTSTASVCVGGGSTTSVATLFADGPANSFTVSPSGANTTATIGITSSLQTNWNALTSTANLVLCEGPAESNGGGQGNPGSATVDPNCAMAVLPIGLLSFNAQSQNNICELQWTAEAQRGLVNFDVEASTDAVNYDVIATVSAEQEMDNYNFTTAIKANTWFRLRLVNQNGGVSYSTIIPIEYQGGTGIGAYVLRVQPNLITDNTLQVWSNMYSAQSGEWWVVDMMGRTVLRSSARLEAGVTTNTIQLPGLASGMYHLLFAGSQIKVPPVVFSVVR